MRLLCNLLFCSQNICVCVAISTFFRGEGSFSATVQVALGITPETEHISVHTQPYCSGGMWSQMVQGESLWVIWSPPLGPCISTMFHGSWPVVVESKICCFRLQGWISVWTTVPESNTFPYGKKQLQFRQQFNIFPQICGVCVCVRASVRVCVVLAPEAEVMVVYTLWEMKPFFINRCSQL